MKALSLTTKIRFARDRLVFVLAAAACGLVAGCALFNAHVNASPDLRWWLFSSFGAKHICPEMVKTNAPLRLTPGTPVIGRFFPSQCTSQVNDERHTVTISFAGTGYAWTPLAQRIGFSASATVEYQMDFRMEDDAVYVWGRPFQIVQPATFQVGSIENPLFEAARRSPVGYLSSTFGAQVLESRIADGFTVVRTDQGDAFALGILEPPARPNGPFQPTTDGRKVLMNETIQLHHDQVDFLGPFELTDSDQKLFVTMHNQGPSVDVLAYDAAVANPWRDALQRGAPLAQPVTPPISGFPLAPGPPVARSVPLPPGTYFLVVANSDRVGPLAPPPSMLGALGANTATIAVQVEISD